MARMARVVIPGIPHHITQRGNRRQKVFFHEPDFIHYKTLLAQYCRRENVDVWAYCLMPNHVHLVMVPQDKLGLRKSLSETHRRYTLHVNSREDWSGYLWQGRFASFPMDDRYLFSAVRYIELNPVRAGLCAKPEQWKWSSARAHFTEKDDGLVSVEPMLNRVFNWSNYLGESGNEDLTDKIRQHSKTGRPLGSEQFLERLESICGRPLKPGKRGPKTLERAS